MRFRCCLALLVGTAIYSLSPQLMSQTQPPRFLYVTEFSAGKVAGYSINATTGALTPIAQSPVWAHWGPTRLASDKGGYRLYVANQGSHDLSAYFINRTTGALTQVPGSPFAAGGTASGVAVHPSGKFVYETTDNTHGGSVGVMAWQVQSNGSLKPVPGAPFQISRSNPNAPIIHPNGNYLYVTDQYQLGVDGYRIDALTGSLTPLPGSPYTTPFGAPEGVDLAIDGAGKYLYGPAANSSLIFGFSIDSTTGVLSALPNNPFSSGIYRHETLLGITIARGTTHAFVADVQRSAIEFFGVGSNGTLTYIGDTSTATGTNCVGEFPRTDPSGKFLYTISWNGSCPTGPGLYGYAVQSNGTLLPLNVHAKNSNITWTDSLVITP